MDTFNIALPITEIAVTKLGDNKDYITLVCMGKHKENEVGFRFNIDRGLKAYLKFDKDAKNFLKETGEAQFEDGGAFFTSIGEPSFEFCKLLEESLSSDQKDEEELDEPRDFVACSSMLIFGNLEKIKNVKSAEKEEKIAFKAPTNLDLTQGEGSDQILLKVITYDQENFENNSDLNVQIDLTNKIFYLSENEKSKRLNLLKAFAVLN